MLFIHFIIALAIFFPLTLFVITLIRAYQEDGNPTNINLFFLLLLLFTVFFTSCTKEEIVTPTCINNDCSAQFYIPGELDSNGFYHIELEWDNQYYPRFTIDIDATITDPWYWYNGVPAVQANFHTEDTWEIGNDILPVVQGARVYLRKYSDTRAKGKRIVGPFPPRMKGDTIEISSRVWWEAGMQTKYEDFSLKFIVE